VHLPRVRVVQVRGGALDPLLDDGAVAAGPGPAAEEAVLGDFDEDSLARLVLHEAEEGGRVGAVEGDEVQVDDVGGVLVDEGLRGAEGLEVVCVGVADADVGGRAGVPGVRGRVLKMGVSVLFRWCKLCGCFSRIWRPSGQGIALLRDPRSPLEPRPCRRWHLPRRRVFHSPS
jgi:hypothetical protein